MSQTLLLLGASGAVGQHVLRLALADARVASVTAPTRRPLAPLPRLVNPVVDFGKLPVDAPWYKADAVICALGTTMRAAGSQAAFAAVDRDLPITLASRARAAGARAFALNSSLGASLKGNYYLRTKAEAEEGIRSLGFERYCIVRPALIAAERAELRLGEALGIAAGRVLGRLLPANWRPVSAEAVARCLLEEVLASAPGVVIVESGAIAAVAKADR